MMNYLAQYTMDLPSRAEQTPAVLAAARQWLRHSTRSPGPYLRTGFASIRGKTVFSLRHANDRQDKQDEEISTHEILAESEL